jgi:hypothetical protein
MPDLLDSDLLRLLQCNTLLRTATTAASASKASAPRKVWAVVESRSPRQAPPPSANSVESQGGCLRSPPTTYGKILVTGCCRLATGGLCRRRDPLGPGLKRLASPLLTCTACGHRGATIQHPAWGGADIGFLPLPIDRAPLTEAAK